MQKPSLKNPENQKESSQIGQVLKGQQDEAQTYAP